jgi:uncharacterized protein (TIGR02145 family)
MGTDDAMAYFKSGDAHFQNGNADAAIADFTRSIKLDSNYAVAYFSRGIAYAGTGKLTEAIDDFTQYLRLVGNSIVGNKREEAMASIVYCARGSAYCENDQCDKAIEDFSSAIKLTPDNADAYLGRAQAHRKNRTIDKAVLDIEAALRIDPNNADAKKFLGIAKKMQLAKNQFSGGAYWNDHEQIIKDMSQIIDSDPAFAEARYIRGLAYNKAGKKDDALKDYEKAVELDPGNKEYAKILSVVYAEHGGICIKKNNIGDGIEYLNKALNLNGDDVMALEARGTAYMLVGKYNLGIDDFNRILRLNPNHPNASKFIEEARRFQNPPVSPSRPTPQFRPAPKTTNNTMLPVILSVVVVLVSIVVGIVLFGGSGLDFLNRKTAVKPVSLPQDQTEIEQEESGTGQNELPVERDHDYFVDSRDGQKYRSVRIGNRAWMNRNLNYKPQTGRSWCYNDNNSNCAKYGRLYDWNTARAVCPSGWHLPNRQEWSQLASAAGGDEAGTALKARSGWIDYGNGTDNYGFSAQAGGSRTIDGDFKNAGNRGLWWTAAEYDSDSAYYRRMGYNYDYVYEGTYGKGHGFSVRCVQ